MDREARQKATKNRLPGFGAAILRSSPGVIYFLQPGEIQKVKIGYSNNLPARIKAVQTGSCEILKLLGVIPRANLNLEYAIHCKFGKYRLHNEWFSLVPEILDFLNSKAKFPAYDYSGNWIGNFNSEEEAKAATKAKFTQVFGEAAAAAVEAFR